MQKLTGSEGGKETRQRVPVRVRTSALLWCLEFKANLLSTRPSQHSCVQRHNSWGLPLARYKNNISLNPHNTCSCLWVFTVSQKFALMGKLIISTYRPYMYKSLDRQSSRTHGRTKVLFVSAVILRLDFCQPWSELNEHYQSTARTFYVHWNIRFTCSEWWWSQGTIHFAVYSFIRTFHKWAVLYFLSKKDCKERLFVIN